MDARHVLLLCVLCMMQFTRALTIPQDHAIPNRLDPMLSNADRLSSLDGRTELVVLALSGSAGVSRVLFQRARPNL